MNPVLQPPCLAGRLTIPPSLLAHADAVIA